MSGIYTQSLLSSFCVSDGMSICVSLPTSSSATREPPKRYLREKKDMGYCMYFGTEKISLGHQAIGTVV